MKYLLILPLCLIAVSKITVQTRFSKSSIQNDFCSILYNAISFATAAVILLPLSFKDGIDTQVLVQGAIMGVLSFAFQLFYINALKCGKVALTVIINNFSMLIPITLSALVLKEKLGVAKIVGMVLVLIAFVLTTSQSGDMEKNISETDDNRRWLFYVISVFVCNGAISVNQKLYSVYSKELRVFEFVAVAYITAAVISTLVLTYMYVDVKSIPTKDMLPFITSGGCVGVLLGVFQCLNTYAASQIDGITLYSVYNCGVSLMSVVIGRVIFAEQLSVSQIIGVATGTLAIVLMCL